MKKFTGERTESSSKYEAVVIGVSSGGMEALGVILPALSQDFACAVIVVQHLHPHSGKFWVQHFDQLCSLPVKEADEKERICPGTIYFAPPNYHLLIEHDLTFSLSVDEKVNYARPAVDVLFDTAAEAYGAHLIGVILTGANNDGSQGLKQIKTHGGLTIVQTPENAEAPEMPRAAITATAVDYVLPLKKIGSLLNTFSNG